MLLGWLNLRTKKLRLIKRPLFKKFLVFFGTILLTLGLYNFSSDFFSIKTIKIAAGPEDVLKGIEKLSHLNLLFLDIKKWEEELEKENSILKEIKIKKELPSGVLIEFEKRKAKVALFDPSSTKFYYLDEEGIILEEAQSSYKLPLIIASLQNFKIGDRIKDKNIDLALSVIKVLEETAQEAKFEVDGSFKVLRAETRDKVLILIGLEQKKEEIVYSLQILAKKFKIEGNWPKRIDLRFEKPILTF